MFHHNIKNIGMNTVAGLLAALCLLLSNTAWATADCVLIEGEGNIDFIGPLEPGPDPVAVGTVTYQFPDSVREALVTGFLLEPPKYTDIGTAHLTIKVVHDFPNGDNLTWRLEMVLSPTEEPGEFLLNERANVIYGAGIYADAFGRGTGHGTASFNTLSAQVFFKGRLCGIAQ